MPLNYINELLASLFLADSIYNDNKNWDPITFGFNNLSEIYSDTTPSINDLNYQSMNLFHIADAYFTAGLYYDGVSSVVDAISIDYEDVSIEFLYNYIAQHLNDTPQMINVLINYSYNDSLALKTDKLLLSIIHYDRSENELANQYIDEYIKSNKDDFRAYQLLGDYYLNNEEYLSALFNYKKSQQISPNNIYSLFKSSVCLYYLNYQDEAIELLSTLLQLNP